MPTLDLLEPETGWQGEAKERSEPRPQPERRELVPALDLVLVEVVLDGGES